ncbi:hypothetical protein, variant 2 [Verruconis gallopava]|nr:hypothetical protein, variant 2 [Verruconis gallopava]KIW06776.1 hypothetical protein, variant 2 [Verruconis gallopava]
MSAHLQSLQQQVDTLYSNLSSLRNQIDMQGMPPMASSPYSQHTPYQRPMSIGSGGSFAQPGRQLPKHPEFRGPTSAVFNLGVAKSSLQHMGITGGEDGPEEGLTTQDVTPSATPPPMIQPDLPKSLHADKDAIWSLNKDEAVRLIHVWQDEMGTMYPIVDIDRLIRHTHLLFTFMEAARRSGLMEASLPGADAIHDDQTNCLKLIVAIALTLEGSGKSDLGRRLWDCVKASIETISFNPPDVKGLQMLVLAAMYHFHCDDESLAWRLTGNAARMAMELGLHRHETYTTIFSTDAERNAATILFWSIYVLDRRWSFGTGMPFALQDADIDPLLQKPDAPTPYLMAMVAYSQLGSKVWQRVANNDANRAPLSSEEMGYLDYQIMQWHRTLPESLTYIAPGTALNESHLSRSDQRLRINMYCRMNQMRILIYRPVLHSATSISENMREAQQAVEVAKDTIRVVKRMDETTDLYRSQQVMFNYFLVQALAVLFLAVAHAPAQFSSRCRDEFYMALDLVRGMTAHSYVSKRLWKTIRGLKEIGPKLGLNMRNPAVDSADPHSSAAVAMVGLAGNPMDEISLFAGQNGLNDSPNGMANDLTNLFEAAGNYGSGLIGNGYSEVSGNGGEGLASAFGHQDELSKILRDLF